MSSDLIKHKIKRTLIKNNGSLIFTIKNKFLYVCIINESQEYHGKNIKNLIVPHLQLLIKKQPR